MKNLIALVAIAFGAYIVYTGNAEGLHPVDALKAVAGIGGGLIFLIANNAVAVKDFVVNNVNKVKLVSPTEPVKHDVVLPAKLDNGMYPPNDYELYDNVSLIHIRNRLVKAGHQDGIELCTKLAGILFTLDVAQPRKQDVVADATNPENVKA